MTYELIELGGEWIVCREGHEVARFARRGEATDHLAGLMRKIDVGDRPVSLRLRYQLRELSAPGVAQRTTTVGET
jgi:hypothetical protein